MKVLPQPRKEENLNSQDDNPVNACKGRRGNDAMQNAISMMTANPNTSPTTSSVPKTTRE